MPIRGNIFKDQLVTTPKRSWFDMSFDNSFTCNMGKLIPTICKELLPKDVIKMKSSAFMRLMPLVSPVMGKLNLFSYHFIVRNRDIWTNWDKFITNEDQKKTWQQNQNFIPPEMPYIDIFDVFKHANGYMPNSALSLEANLFWFRNCYYLICVDYDESHKFCVISREAPNLNNLDNKCDSVQIYVFVPNREDIFEGIDYVVGDEQVHHITTTRFYNPFAAGSLMDFLGVNIDGFYSEIADNLLNVSRDNGLRYALKETYNTWYQLQPSDYNDTSMTLEEMAHVLGDLYPKNLRYANVDSAWFNQHLVVGFGSKSDNNSYINILSIDGQYLCSADNAYDIGRLANFDYLSADRADQFDTKLNALPLRAYRFIYDEYFRDQNYIEVNPNTDFSRDGNDLDIVNQPFSVLWQYLSFEAKAFEHDPYTTALPGPQKGEPVRFLNDAVLNIEPSGVTETLNRQTIGVTDTGDFMVSGFGSISGQKAEVSVDLSTATIENFRWANAMQRFLERKARTGGRYYEYLLGIWGSEVSDAKLNRPIYLKGDRTPVQIGEIAQTSSTNVSTGQPLGDLAGRGVAIGRDKRICFTMPDYGFLFEVSVVVPRTCYGQGIDQKFKRFNYMDYPLPDFAQLGEEAVRKMELYATLFKSIDESAFGWQSRYYYWKYNRDEVHSSMLTDLKHWNFARLFDSVPYSGKEFLEVNPSYRQFAVTDDSFDHCIVTMWHDIKINRALPEFGTPIL